MIKRGVTGLRKGISSLIFGRGLLLVFVLCAQLLMPVHVLGHELSMEPSGTCAICPVGQNLIGVSPEAHWLALLAFIAPPVDTDRSQVVPRVSITPFDSRAPPSIP